jgi:hypothetical protein
MSELKRLRDHDSDRVARLLLDAGHFDDPPKKRLDRIVAGIAGTGAAVGVKTAAASSALAAAPIAVKSATPIALVFKWLGVGVLAGVVVSGGAATLQPDNVVTDAASAVLPPPTAKGDPEGTRGSRRSFEPVQHERLTPAATPPDTEKPGIARSSSSLELTPRAVQGVSPPVPGRAAAPAFAQPSPAAELTAPAVAENEKAPGRESAEPVTKSVPDHALREELAALAFAKSALNRGSARTALNAVRAYRKRFRAGVLAREATYIEMEAEHELGNRSRAVELAVELAPGVTPNAERAREILKGQ